MEKVEIALHSPCHILSFICGKSLVFNNFLHDFEGAGAIEAIFDGFIEIITERHHGSNLFRLF